MMDPAVKAKSTTTAASSSAASSHTCDGIVITYSDPSGQCYALIEKTLLKILSMMVTVPNPDNVNAPYRLNDRVGLWPAHQVLSSPAVSPPPPGQWHRMPYLCLYLVLLENPSMDTFSSALKSSILAWVAETQEAATGHVVIFVTLDSPTLSLGAQAASYLWKKFSPSKAIFFKELATLNVVTHELHPLLRDGAERHSILRRDAEPLAAIMARQLGLGFAKRIERYRLELKSRDVSHNSAYVETLEGLAFVYSKLSMFSSALLLYDDWELLLDKERADDASRSDDSATQAKQRCLNCGLWFDQGPNQQPCRYHSGKLVSMGRLSLVPKWTCCGGYGETCAPCVVNGVHAPDPAFSLLGLRQSSWRSSSSSAALLLGRGEPFRPIVNSPAAPLLDPSSHLPVVYVDSPPLRQYLLARQCRLLAYSGQYIKLGRRLLRFVYFAIRSSRVVSATTMMMAPLSLESWCYRICLEATRLFLAQPAAPPSPVEDDAVGRAVVLAGLYKVMRASLSAIGLAWFPPPPIRDASWDDMMQEMVQESSDASSRELNSSASAAASTPERIALKVSAFQTQVEPSIEDPWFVNADCELEVPSGRFVDDNVSPLLLCHRGLRAYLGSRASLVDSLRRLAGKELIAWKVSRRERTEMCATVELARVYFDLGRFDEAQLLVRSVHHRYANSGWSSLYFSCMVMLCESEMRLGHTHACVSACLQLVTAPGATTDNVAVAHRYAQRLVSLLRIPGRTLVKPLEPLFETRVSCDAGTNLMQVTIVSLGWPMEVLMDRVVVELTSGADETPIHTCLATDTMIRPQESLSWSFPLPQRRPLSPSPSSSSPSDTIPGGPFHSFHKLLVHIGTLVLVHLEETLKELVSTPPIRAAAVPLPLALSTRLIPAMLPMDEALLPTLVPEHQFNDGIMTVLYDPVVHLPLLLQFHSPLIECTLWCTFGRVSLIHARGEEGLPLLGQSSTQATCEGREDDALVIRGKFQSGDQVRLAVPIRARLLWEKFGQEQSHSLEFILACRIEATKQAHAAFRHMAVRVMAPFSVSYASIISSGSFRHLVIRVVCQVSGIAVKTLNLTLTKEWFLVSSENSLLGATLVGTVLWFRYCMARFGTEGDDGLAQAARDKDDSDCRSILILCNLDHVRLGGRDETFAFSVDLRTNLGDAPSQDLVTNLVETALSSNVPRADETEEANSSSDQQQEVGVNIKNDQRKTLLNLRGNVFFSKDAPLIARSLLHCGHTLERLILENCELGTAGTLALASALAHCRHLHTLNLFGNTMGTEGMVAVCAASKYVEGGVGLRELDLGRNDCSHPTAAAALAALVAATPTLRILRLWRCFLSAAGIDAITSASLQHDSLRELDLGFNSLGPSGATSVASWLSSNPSLETLSLWYANTGPEGGATIAQALATNGNLRSLDMRSNMLNDKTAFNFADALRSNSVLTDLQLQDNLIGESGLLELGKVMHHGNYVMESLVVVENRADAFESLPHLERIVEGVKRNRAFKDKAMSPEGTFVVSGQGLTAIPPQLGGGSGTLSERLTVLSLERNDIRNFSPGLAKLTALTSLNMCHNQLRHIGSELSSLKELTLLRLEGNLISKVPASVFVALTKLQTLDLSSNRLDEFPECVNVLPSLQRLSLAKNIISALPPSYASRLTGLRILDLANNRLASIPPEIAHMTSLRILHLQSNLLEMLPPALGRVEWDSFHVEENPLSCIPSSTLAKGSRGVLYFLRDLLSGSDYFYRVKLLVTGQANVGKTTLLSALKNEVGNVNKVLRLLTGKGRRSSTSGIALEDWKPHKSIITFSTWDFGGQLVYYTTHQFFLSKRALYLLVFSMAKGLQQNRLLSWLNSIQSRAPGVGVMLVGTCLDDKKNCGPARVAELAASVRRTITAWERSFLPGERLQILKNSEDVWFYPVSSLTGEGITEVRTRLLDAAADQPSLRERVPLLYLKLLDVVRLQRRAENVPITTWARLREWAGFDDEKQLERAVQLLHDWGELLWFSESPALRDVVVLSPQWLTAMFATIISTKENDDTPAAYTSAANRDSSMSESERSTGNDTLSEDAELAFSNPASPRVDNSGSSTLRRASLRFNPGIIEKKALTVRWAAYDPAHFPFFEALLERFDLWVPLEGGARFLVPCLLKARSDEEECGLEWSQVLFGRAFILPFPLHGFFERCLVQLHRLYLPCRHWKGEALMAGPGSIRIFAQIRDCQIPNHAAHGQRLAFFFAADPSDEVAARSAVASIMFIVHNFLQDWYNPSLRDQVVTEAICPKCCSADQTGGTFNMQDVLRTQVIGVVSTVACPLCTIPLDLVRDLVPEILDPVHARSDYDTEVEELRHVADGAFSRVFQCRWRNDEIVAVKRLRVQSITVSWFLEFLQEISMLQTLRHKNLVSIRAAYLRPLCIVLEWVAGGSLDQAISRFRGPHDWPVLWTVLRDISSGMAFLHAQQPLPIYHRDLKTMNILVCNLQADADPCVKIADLGSSCPSFGKVSGRIIHNPRWKPPELFSGVEYTAASDVYAFALIMWELVGRAIPFHELNWPSLIEDKILLGERPSMKGLEDVRNDYYELMHSCWAQDPLSRPTFAQIVCKLSTLN